jgi:hypothetical protein
MTTPATPLQAPFPWFGGKSRVAADVWQRFGNVINYVEPFFGSGAVLLARPGVPGTETVNDKDRYVANFWRAVAADPDAVARHVDWPVNETDLTARHLWLVNEGARRIERCDGDPFFYDAQVAGWWCWGLCSWIGSGWCSGNGGWTWGKSGWMRGSEAGRGIARQRPHLNAGQGVHRKANVTSWLQALAARLRRVRVACGDWSRVCGDTVTHKQGLTGVFLDPPYSGNADRYESIYNQESLTVAYDVVRWAIANGGNPLMRIAVCGYDGEHDFPADWSVHRWKASGGYGRLSDGRGRKNAGREVIWFSPHCLAADQPGLFDVAVAEEAQ